jgi:hypothetical protein
VDLRLAEEGLVLQGLGRWAGERGEGNLEDLRQCDEVLPVWRSLVQ